ncbi:MAG: hypothetical protein A2Y41_04440 [Spirochaetes bacterium GWB1_36_13]|nr:MAG: hypothetical protein A2Y41_04440 [Spirochaetes bacterium GWB1_36_13]
MKLLFILALTGAVLSFILLLIDAGNQTLLNTCSANDVINCAKVAQSKWSHIGPVPVALLGFFFYLFILFYIVLSDNKEAIYLAASWLFLLGSLMSVFLFLVSWFDIKAFCLYCSATYLINWVLFFLFSKYFKFNLSKIFNKSGLKALVFALVLSIGLSGVALWATGSSSSSAGTTSQKDGFIVEYQQLPENRINKIWTPFYGGQNPKVEIITYSSFFCSHCKIFSEDLEKLMSDPKYFENIRVYYKIYSSSKSCDPNTFTLANPSPCIISYLGFEMIRKGLFWEFEKKVRETPNLSAEIIKKIAEEINKDPIDYKNLAANNQKYFNMVEQEIKLLGVEATPTWYINGKRFVGAYPMPQVKQLIDYIIENEKK